MDKPFYDFQILENARRFEFESVGFKRIRKTVVFGTTSFPEFYSMGLADVQVDGSYDFEIESNNGDRDMILATVAQILLLFLNERPQAIVGFTGNTQARTRLYQIILARELWRASEQLVIKGLIGRKLEFFQANRTYEGFVISRRNA